MSIHKMEYYCIICKNTCFCDARHLGRVIAVLQYHVSFIFSFVLQQKRVRVWRQTTFERNFYPGNVMARLSRGAKGRCVFYFVSFVRCPDIRRTSFFQFPVLYSSMKYSIDAVCKFLAPGFRLWRPRRFALGTRPARCRRRILESRERRFAFPSGWGRLR